MKERESEVVRLYVDECMPAKNVANQVGIAQRHVYRILRKHNVTLRHRETTEVVAM